ncbi:MAG: hypothetical protein GF381_00075 [Candidatus Pacebacteria bacterium]|nr:hypothetical protein [Candidatus Paceibacterota bacterium]
MNLPNLFKKDQPTSPEGRSFLSIFLTDQIVQSAWWELVDQEIEIISQSKVHYFTQPDKKVVVIDESLQELGPGSEKINDIVFGFEPEWVTQSGLAEERKEFLQQVTEELDLEAAGFVVITEALSEYLIDKKPLLSTVLVYLAAETLHLVLIKQGKVVSQQSAGRSGDLIADLRETLARLAQATAEQSALQLPPNLVLVSSSLSDTELREQHQLLISRQWHQDFEFIQTPLISILAQDKLVEAVVLEGGEAVAKTQVIKAEPDQPEPEPVQAQSVDSTDSTDPTASAETAVSTQIESDLELTNQPSSQDMSNSSNQPAKSVRDSESTTSSFGLPIKKNFVASLTRKERKASPIKKSTKIKQIIIFGIIFGLLTLLGLGWFFLQRSYQAVLELVPAQMTVSKDVQITLDPDTAQSDPEELILKVDQVSRSVEDTDSLQTTGIKLVGDKAKGKVTIFNKTTQDKTFDQGTELSTDELIFVLTQELNVPAAEVQENETGDGEIKEYGQADAEIEAVEIGAEANLEKDTQLQVASFSDETYNAKVSEALTGGSSREIRVVSEEDRQNLSSKLVKALLQKAKSEFESASQDGEYYLPTATYQITNQSWSVEVGDEAEELQLTMTVELEGISYKTENLKPLAVNVLEKEVPQGYQLLDEDPDILSQPADEVEDSTTYQLEANLSIGAEALLDPETVKQAAAGLSLQEAAARLRSQEGVDQAQIKLTPLVASWLMRKVPAQTDRIRVELD